MALERYLLTLNPGEASERQYEISMIERVGPDQRKEALSISPPGAAPSENILLGVSGMQQDISVDWYVHDDGTDKANGTHTSTVVTVEEQISYLYDVMHSPDFSASWELNHETGATANDIEVFVENISVPWVANDSPKWKQATMRLRRGGSVG